jgi:cell division GTPase FtsZ
MSALDMDAFEPEEMEPMGPVIDVDDVPDIPVETKKVVADEILDASKKPIDVAFKFAFVGVGQAGGRLARQFHQYGYRRVCAINTAQADLQLLKLPDENKLVIGETKGGAGGDPEVGKLAVLHDREKVHDLMLSSFGEDFDRIFVCASIGGGTGAGGCQEVVDIAKEMMARLELSDKEGKDPRVGMILVLPRESDGPASYASAGNVLAEVVEKAGDRISPVIMIDNQRFDKSYPDAAVSQFFGKTNHAVCSIFHLLNLVSAQPSAITPFDPKDYETVLSSGILTFGAAPIAQWQGQDAIGDGIRKLMTHQAMVSGVDISTASVAGCVLVAGQSILDNLPNSHLEKAYSMLARMINKDAGAAIRRGVYSGSKENVAMYVVLGGLDKPDERIASLKKRGNV